MFVDRFIGDGGEDSEFLGGGDGVADDAVYLSDSDCAFSLNYLPVDSI